MQAAVTCAASPVLAAELLEATIPSNGNVPSELSAAGAALQASCACMQRRRPVLQLVTQRVAHATPTHMQVSSRRRRSAAWCRAAIGARWRAARGAACRHAHAAAKVGAMKARRLHGAAAGASSRLGACSTCCCSTNPLDTCTHLHTLPRTQARQAWARSACAVRLWCSNRALGRAVIAYQSARRCVRCKSRRRQTPSSAQRQQQPPAAAAVSTAEASLCSRRGLLWPLPLEGCWVLRARVRSL